VGENTVLIFINNRTLSDKPEEQISQISAPFCPMQGNGAARPESESGENEYPF
jgi:hypothetical protein